MALSEFIPAQIGQRHNIKLSDDQSSFLNIMYGRPTCPGWRHDWKLKDFDSGLYTALLLYPDDTQHPEFVPPPSFEQISFDDFMD
jgi:hypothetical protein